MVLLGGCSPSEPTVGVVNGRDVSAAEFERFLTLKRIDKTDTAKTSAALATYLDREALADTIAAQDVLDADLVEAEINEFRKEMLISRYFDEYLARNVTDDAVRNYYATHASDYEQRQVRVAHILVRTSRNMSEPERLAKLTTAQEAYSRVYAGADFGEVATDYSEDQVSAKKGGDLGWMKQGAIDPKFSSVIFDLEAGAVSEPFETPFGFHIVKKLEDEMVVRRPFDTVKGDIRYQLRAAAKDAEMQRLLGETEVEIRQ